MEGVGKYVKHITAVFLYLQQQFQFYYCSSLVVQFESVDYISILVLVFVPSLALRAFVRFRTGTHLRLRVVGVCTLPL